MELEKKLKELEETAAKLDSKDIPLEEAISLFENGVSVIRSCMDMLREGKGRIDGILAELNDLLADEGEEN